MEKDKQAISLEQYRIYVKSAEENSERRGAALDLFAKLNSAYLVFAGVALGVLESSVRLSAMMIICMAGVLTAVTFGVKLNGYKRINEAKYIVIQKMEKKLPLCPYTDEWKLLGEGKDRRKYIPLSNIDVVIVWIIGLVYLLSMVALLSQHIDIIIAFH